MLNISSPSTQKKPFLFPRKLSAFCLVYQNPPADPTHSQMNPVKTHNNISVI